MRLLRRNSKSMKYALQIGEAPIYKTDLDGNILYETYVDSEGNEFPLLDDDGNKIPLETGETEIFFSDPCEFTASISMSGGEAEAVEYGLSTADYQAVLLYANGTVPLVEGALIWTKDDVKYKYNEETEIETEKGLVKGKFPIPTSSDFEVIKINKALNFTRAILKATVK